MEPINNTIMWNLDMNQTIYPKNNILLKVQDSNNQEGLTIQVDTEDKGENLKQDQRQNSNNANSEQQLVKGDAYRTRAEYTYHKELNRVSIKIVNESTQEVIREIPPEKSMEVLKQLMEIPGLFVDERR